MRAILGALILSTQLQAQVTIDARQGDTWTDHLSMTALETMTFRWKYEGNALTNAAWQITYTAPSSTTSPVVKSVSIGVPSQAGVYSTFSIPATMVPTDAPSTFYVRVRSTNGFSPWLPVSIAQRRTTETQTNLAGALTDTRRVESTSTSSLSGALAGTDPVLTEGVSTPAYMPLWVKLTRIICKETTDDGSPSDEMYVIVTSIAINPNNIKESRVSTRVTSVFEDIDINEHRDTDLALWGVPSGEAQAIPFPENVIILVAPMESDGDRPRDLAVQLINAGILGKLYNMTKSTSRAYMIDQFQHVMFETIDKVLAHTGHDLPDTPLTTAKPLNPTGGGIGEGDDFLEDRPRLLNLTDQDIAAARVGTLVKKSLTFVSDGKYELHFQLGRAGANAEKW